MDRSVILRPSTAAVVVLFFVIYTIVNKLLGNPKVPPRVPWVGRDETQWFPNMCASFRSFRNLRSMTEEGYGKYSQFGKPFIAPNFLVGPEVLLPATQISRILEAPEHVLSAKEVHQETIQHKYTINNTHVMNHLVHIDIIRKQLTRNLGTFTGVLHEELEMAFADQWGTDTENWREINVSKTMMQIVARTSNRIFVGVPLCRNPEFLENCQLYARSIFGNGLLIKNFPKWARPVVAPLLTRSNRRYLANCFKYSKPVIMERLELTEKKMTDPKYKDFELPNDYIQWQIDESYKLNDPVERDPAIINQRLMIVNFVSLHTSSITSTATIFDLYSAAPSERFIEGLRDECDRVISANGGKWTKSGLGQMIRLDSAIKESMRLSGMGLRSLRRIVKDPNGFECLGVRIPLNGRLAFPAASIHNDGTLYSDPLRYDAFRFSAPREAWGAARGSHDAPSQKSAEEARVGEISDDKAPKSPYDAARSQDLDKILEFKNNSMVTVSDEFLSFGNGPHACPGRFFASNEIKILIAFMVQNYDVEPLMERPRSRDFVDVAPPPTASIRVKRAKRSETSDSV